MQAHANDLRSEINNDWPALLDSATDVRTNPAAGARPTAAVLDEFVHQAVRDWRACRMRAGAAALLEYAEKVTRSPAACVAADVDALRRAGWSDAAIHDAAQIVAYFNYINRVVDALGVEPEIGLARWGDRGPGLDPSHARP